MTGAREGVNKIPASATWPKDLLDHLHATGQGRSDWVQERWDHQKEEDMELAIREQISHCDAQLVHYTERKEALEARLGKVQATIIAPDEDTSPKGIFIQRVVEEAAAYAREHPGMSLSEIFDRFSWTRNEIEAKNLGMGRSYLYSRLVLRLPQLAEAEAVVSR